MLPASVAAPDGKKTSIDDCIRLLPRPRFPVMAVKENAHGDKRRPKRWYAPSADWRYDAPV